MDDGTSTMKRKRSDIKARVRAKKKQESCGDLWMFKSWSDRMHRKGEKNLNTLLWVAHMKHD